ncbi:MAG: hypothetical protein RLZZ447_1975, partial [Verrucomicrobiota bacterium]
RRYRGREGDQERQGGGQGTRRGVKMRVHEGTVLGAALWRNAGAQAQGTDCVAGNADRYVGCASFISGTTYYQR